MDIKKLLRSLLDHKVRFLIVGAWALPAYGRERMTRDVHVFIKPTKANAERTMEALMAVGYGIVKDTPVSLFLSKKILLRQYPMQVDLHPFVAGISFGTAWKNRVETEIKGLRIFVPSLDDLIKMKKAAGRAKDREDLREREKIRQKETAKKTM